MRVTKRLCLWSMGKEAESSKIKMVDFKDTDFNKFREQVGKIICKDSLWEKEVKEN